MKEMNVFICACICVSVHVLSVCALVWVNGGGNSEFSLSKLFSFYEKHCHQKNRTEATSKFGDHETKLFEESLKLYDCCQLKIKHYVF